MADLISRETALEAIQGLRHAAAANFAPEYSGVLGIARTDSFYEAYQAVKGLPAAPGMEAEGRNPSGVRGEARQPADAVGAPPPVPSPEVEEIQRIGTEAMDKLQSAYFEAERGSKFKDASLAAIQAITVLLSRITLSPAPSDQGMIQRARGIVADKAQANGCVGWANTVRSGGADDCSEMKVVLRALQSPSTGDGGGDGRRPDVSQPRPDDTIKAACEPWKFGVGDPPDDGSPLIGPYSAGIGYAIDRLAKLTEAGDYVGADGSETFEGDVDGTIMNVLRAARLYDDETGKFGDIFAPDANSGGEAPGRDAAHLEWAISRWNAEVANRPLQNVHRRALDTTWRQMIRRFGGDPDALVGPSHDALAASPRPSQEKGEGRDA